MVSNFHFFFFLDSGNHTESQTNIRQEPTFSEDSSSKSESSSQKEMGVQTVQLATDLDKSSYVVDRVLTPSIFRVRAKTGGQGREFGTQTDIHYGRCLTEDAESTERLLDVIVFAYNNI